MPPVASRLVEEIARVCGEHVLEEKWLLCPSLRLGYQWIDCVTRRRPVANLRPKTLPAIAHDLARPEITRLGLTPLSGWGGPLTMARAWENALGDRRGYLASLRPSPELFESLYGTLLSLRLAGVSPTSLQEESFEVGEKGRELAALLAAYAEALAELRLADYADILRMAASGAAAALPDTGLLLVPSDTQFGPLERAVIDTVAADRRVVLAVDEPGSPADRPPATDAERLRFLSSPDLAGEPIGDGSVAVFHAAGEVSEVREALRRCLVGPHPLDTVEILHTDRETYLPLIYEVLCALAHSADPPATFADGIPAAYSRPGRALATWAEWIRDGYPQPPLTRMVRDGLLQTDEASDSHLAAVLRGVPVGFGRERYVPALEQEIEAAKRRVSDPALEDDCQPALQRRLAALASLRSLTDRLLPCLPGPGADLLASAQRFLEQLVRCETEFDNYAREVLLKEIRDLSIWREVAGEMAGLDVLGWLAALPSTVRVLGQGPRPGKLHVAPLHAGGHSGRPNTFILGLDDARFPGAAAQDPILLDSERRRVSEELPTAGARLQRQIGEFERLLARLRGRLFLSFSSRDLVEDRERFPSPVIVSAFRLLSGATQGGRQGVPGWLGPPAGMAPAEADLALDLSEWWLWRLCGKAPADARAAVTRHYPHLAQGRLAAAERYSDRVSRYDGCLDEPPADLDPTTPEGPVLSASRLETLGACPLRYFLRYVLEIEPPEELLYEPGRWLDPAQFGQLLHAVLCDFMTQLTAEGALPSRRDEGRLLQVLGHWVERYAEEFPPPSVAAQRSQVAKLLRACKAFLAEEVERGNRYTPRYFEAAIGLPPTGEGTPLDWREPVSIPLGNDRTMRARGRIDRIDETGEGRFALSDYKSGSTYAYVKQQPFWQGRVVQHALYVALAQARFREAVSPEACVAEFSFFFAAGREPGTRLTYPVEELSEGLTVIDALCRLAAGGCYCATDDKDDCTYCDYAAVCRDTARLADAAQTKLANAANARLEPLRELRSDA
jgi:ATP-dependent helicase/nuclease subunit B